MAPVGAASRPCSPLWYKRVGKNIAVDDFVSYDKIKWSGDLKLKLVRGVYATFDELKVRSSLYRPFCRRWLFFDRTLIERVYVNPHIFPNPETERDNREIAATSPASEKPFMALAANSIADLHLVGAGAASQCFPFFTYDEDGTNRRENITDWALEHFRKHYKDETITKWDIFYYVYGVLHHTAYREKFAENLKRELPRIPFIGGNKGGVSTPPEVRPLTRPLDTFSPERSSIASVTVARSNG